MPARALADAHGTPILVGQSGGALSASGPISDSEGFASQMFFEDDEDGDPLPPATLPNVGPVIIWHIPGYNITGLNNQASLSIEVLARPVKDSNPLEQRILWFWDPLSALVEPATSDLHLLGTGQRYTTLSPDDMMAPAPFLMAQTLTGHQNFHNHGLLSYALDNDSPPADGAYGFFARLVSNQYSPSNPFLIVLNYGVDYEQMVTAALAINAAAVDSPSGDYNNDGTVDAADYVMWRKKAGTTDEYETWRETFGTPSGGMGAGDLTLPSAAGAAPVPEPSLSQILAHSVAC